MALILSLGKIDLSLLKDEFGKIQTDEIIITEERINHIKMRHPEDYSLFNIYGAICVKDPDYIIKDGKHDGTIFIVKNPTKNLIVR